MLPYLRGLLILFFVDDYWDAREPATAETRSRLPARNAKVQGELIHLVISRAVPVPIIRAVVHREWHHSGGAGVGADYQHLGFTITGGELPVDAGAAEMRAAHRGTVLDFEFAHDIFSSIRTCRMLLTGEQTVTDFTGCPAIRRRDD